MKVKTVGFSDGLDVGYKREKSGCGGLRNLSSTYSGKILWGAGVR